MLDIDLNTLKHKKIALVLSGGVVKAGAWHIGVAKALQEAGISFKNLNSANNNELEISTFVGSSAGSFIGALLASGFSPQEIMNSALGTSPQLLNPIRYRDIFSLKRRVKPLESSYFPFDGLPFYLKKMAKSLLKITGFFSTEGLDQYLKQNLPCNDFEKICSDLFIVTTALDSTKKIIFGKKIQKPFNTHEDTIYRSGTSISEACAASMSVPPFFSPFPIFNHETNKSEYFIDGEIRETLSTHVGIDNDCDIIINSWTHTPYHFHKEVGSLVNQGLPAICLQAIYLIIQKKIIKSRTHFQTALDTIKATDDFMRAENFTDFQRKKLISILEEKLSIKAHTKFIDICPDSKDYKLFFSGHFSLNSKTIKTTAEMGYIKTIEALSSLE